MFRHGEIVGSCWFLCEDAYFVDEVGDELAPSDLEYLDGLSGSLEGCALSYCVACRPVAIDQVSSSSRSTYNFGTVGDRKSTRLNSSHANISYAVFCLK